MWISTRASKTSNVTASSPTRRRLNSSVTRSSLVSHKATGVKPAAVARVRRKPNGRVTA